MKILVVDDSIFAQKSIIKLLKNSIDNSNFITACNGEEGLETFKKEKPDFTFIDLLMPKMNGHELIKLIKKLDPNAKLIVMSADIQNSVKNEIMNLGIMSFINKPFNNEKAMNICKLIKECFYA